MKSKKYVILGVGIIAVIGLAVGAYYVSQNSVSNEKLVTPEEAKSIMLDKVPGAKVLELSYDGDEKTPKYDGTLIKDKYEYEVDVDAKTGQVIKFEKENMLTSNGDENINNESTTNQQSTTQQNSTQNNNTSANNNVNNNISRNNNASTTKNGYIGESKAKSIMLNKVPGAKINKFYLDNDATPEYEGELIKDGYEYDISVDAKTGEIREFSIERIVAYDDDRYDHDDDRYDD